MDDITMVVVAALLVKEKHGGVSASLQDAYTRVRDALISTADSADVAENVMASLEANPTSPARQLALDELLTTIPADQYTMLRQLANDLIEQVMIQRHGTRILQQLGGFIGVGNTAGTRLVLGRVIDFLLAGDIAALTGYLAVRPPGNPITLAKKPPTPPKEPPPPPTPTEDNPDV